MLIKEGPVKKKKNNYREREHKRDADFMVMTYSDKSNILDKNVHVL